MKYLKHYGEDIEYYIKLDDQDDINKFTYWRDEYDKDNPIVHLSKQSLEYIVNLFPNIVNSVSFVGKNINKETKYRYKLISKTRLKIYERVFIKSSSNTINRASFSVGKSICTIHELTDEYFHVELGYEDFYKCDQLDGLKELLKDKGII